MKLLPRTPWGCARAIIVCVAFPAALALGVFLMVRMPGESYRGPLPPLADEEVAVRQRLSRHVETLAGTIGARHVWRPKALEDSARYVEECLHALDLRVRSQAFETESVTVRNTEAELPGRSMPEQVVIVGAHYDTVPGTPGADDNASGVASLLEMARLLSEEQHPRTLRFVAFVNEEPPFFRTPFMGSRVYARRCRERGERLSAVLVLESIGYYPEAAGSQHYPFPFSLLYPSTGDFIGFVGNVSSGDLVRSAIASFRRQARFPSEGGAIPGWVMGVGWSDQWAFWKEGYQALMVTDTAPFRNPHHHTAEDTLQTLDFDRMARVVSGLARTAADLAGGEEN